MKELFTSQSCAMHLQDISLQDAHRSMRCYIASVEPFYRRQKAYKSTGGSIHDNYIINKIIFFSLTREKYFKKKNIIIIINKKYHRLKNNFFFDSSKSVMVLIEDQNPAKSGECDTRDPLSGRGGEVPEAFLGGGLWGVKKGQKTPKNGVFGGVKIGVKKPEKKPFFGLFWTP